jgi:hypothetical protein
MEGEGLLETQDRIMQVDQTRVEINQGKEKLSELNNQIIQTCLIHRKKTVINKIQEGTG